MLFTPGTTMISCKTQTYEHTFVDISVIQLHALYSKQCLRYQVIDSLLQYFYVCISNIEGLTELLAVAPETNQLDRNMLQSEDFVN